jgi:mannose-1-phosphate guanylyltransferase/mannose-6-phosphate isomerase
MAWSDVGSWHALRDIGQADADGNVLRGDVLAERVTNSYIRSEAGWSPRSASTIVVVVATDDAVLVADADRARRSPAWSRRCAAATAARSDQHVTGYRPWGNYRSVDAGERFQVKRITVKPGGQLSLQKHYHRAEHWVVVQGTALVQRGEESMLVRENESIYIPIGTEHRLENPGEAAAPADRGPVGTLSRRGRHRSHRRQLWSCIGGNSGHEVPD